MCTSRARNVSYNVKMCAFRLVNVDIDAAASLRSIT